jgi:hypothetical protein
MTVHLQSHSKKVLCVGWMVSNEGMLMYLPNIRLNLTFVATLLKQVNRDESRNKVNKLIGLLLLKREKSYQGTEK